jgi:hypothetical protein
MFANDLAGGRDMTAGPWGEVESSSAAAYLIAEELVSFACDTLPGQRVAPDQVETALATRPIVVVLDRLETRMSFDESHGWVMKPHRDLGGLRPIEAVAQGRVHDVLSIIDASFPPER